MIFVFLPAYNEEAALPRLTAKLDATLRNDPEGYRIVVLDDGSSDRTLEAAKKLAATYPMEILRHEKNRGLGQTMIDGLEHCAKICSDEDLIVTLDCDDTHEPKYIPQAIEKIKEGYDMIILSRYSEGGGERGLSTVKSFLSRGAGIFLKLFFPIRGVREYSCGFRVFRASIVKKAIAKYGKDFVRLPHRGFVVTAEILIKLRMMGARVGETPFVLRYDQKPGVSKNKPMKTISGYFALVFLYWGRKA